MDYLDSRITTEQFIQFRGTKASQTGTKTALNLLGYFTKATFDGKTAEEVVLDMQKAIANDGNYNRLFNLFNQFIQWLSVEHKDIKAQKYNSSQHIKAHTPASIRTTISHTRAYCEEFGQIDIPDRKFRRMVKLPKEIKYEPYPLTKKEIRLILDSVSLRRKALYMIMKDTGLREKEALLIKKQQINLDSTPVSIDIPPGNDKSKSTNPLRFITKETAKVVEAYSKEIQNEDYLFIKNLKNIDQACHTEITLFSRRRKKLGFFKTYEHSGRNYITLHSFRAFAATVMAEKYGEEFAHGYVGHTKYLGQYIRYRKTMAEKFQRVENDFNIYETVEVVDESEKVKELEIQMQTQQQTVTELMKAITELQKEKDLYAKEELEIKKLKNLT